MDSLSSVKRCHNKQLLDDLKPFPHNACLTPNLQISIYILINITTQQLNRYLQKFKDYFYRERLGTRSYSKLF